MARARAGERVGGRDGSAEAESRLEVGRLQGGQVSALGFSYDCLSERVFRNWLRQQHGRDALLQVRKITEDHISIALCVTPKRLVTGQLTNVQIVACRFSTVSVKSVRFRAETEGKPWSSTCNSLKISSCEEYLQP